MRILSLSIGLILALYGVAWAEGKPGAPEHAQKRPASSRTLAVNFWNKTQPTEKTFITTVEAVMFYYGGGAEKDRREQLNIGAGGVYTLRQQSDDTCVKRVHGTIAYRWGNGADAKSSDTDPSISCLGAVNFFLSWSKDASGKPQAHLRVEAAKAK